MQHSTMKPAPPAPGCCELATHQARQTPVSCRSESGIIFNFFEIAPAYPDVVVWTRQYGVAGCCCPLPICGRLPSMTETASATARDLAGFIGRHRLPDEFSQVIERCYLPLAGWIEREARRFCPLVVGIGGAQGTGKSTLADFLQLSLGKHGGFSVAVLSLDDFYYTHAERHRLGSVVHPLLATRGVPGTHDLQMLSTCLDQLRVLGPGETMALPRFEKAEDDRADPATWPAVEGPVDIIVLEGWCLGAAPQSPASLGPAINALERVTDAGGVWRRYVNEQLAGAYATLFDRLDHLVYLRAPDFDTVRRWRLDQEHKLAERHVGGMSDAQVRRFVEHFERVTRTMLSSPPPRTDVVVDFNATHACTGLDWRLPGTADDAHE